MRGKLKLVGIATYLIAIILTIFMIVVYLNYVDPYSLLAQKALVVTVFNIVTALAIALLFIFSFVFFKKTQYPEKINKTHFMIFSSSLLGFVFVSYFVTCAILYIKMRLGQTNVLSVNYLAQDKLVQVLYIAGVLLALPSSVYFIMIALKKNCQKNNVLCLMSLSPVVWFSIRLIYTFMIGSSSVNAAGRKLDIVTLCLCVFVFLAESRLNFPALEMQERKKFQRIYITLGYCTVACLIISQITRVLLQFFWLLRPFDTYTLNAVYISVFIYIASRLNAIERSVRN